MIQMLQQQMMTMVALDECDFHDNENDNDHDKKTANSDVYPMSSLATATNYEHAADH